jgi:alpha-beta hydrolase superfamily lysophospholipase
MRERTLKQTSAAGNPLHLCVWDPETSVKGAVVVVHGLGEHGGRYRFLAEHFTGKGLAVYALDLTGFGASGGRRGDVPAMEVYLQDVMAVSRLVDEELGRGARRILLGHSMGGLIGLGLLQSRPDAFKEAVISGPAVDVARKQAGALVAISRGLKLVLPGMTLDNGLKPDELCTDKAVVEAYVKDPLVHRRISLRLFHGMINLGQTIRKQPERFAPDLALLLMHGEGDPICHAPDTVKLHAALPCTRKELKLWPGMLHEIFNEKGKDQVLGHADAFLGLA